MTQLILLTRGLTARVDDEDYSLLSQWRWRVAGRGYAAADIQLDGDRRQVYMHRLLLDAQPGELVDHVDGDPLNNTRANLRLVTPLQNQWNRKPQTNQTGYKGVAYHCEKGKYYARIQAHGKRYFLGYFDTPEEAAAAYDAAARRLFGCHARPNGGHD